MLVWCLFCYQQLYLLFLRPAHSLAMHVGTAVAWTRIPAKTVSGKMMAAVIFVHGMASNVCRAHRHNVAALSQAQKSAQMKKTMTAMDS